MKTDPFFDFLIKGNTADEPRKKPAVSHFSIPHEKEESNSEQGVAFAQLLNQEVS